MKNKYFLSLYKSVKNIFVKPKFTFYIGPWIREPNLPVWRRGPVLNLCKTIERKNIYNYATLKSSEWNDLGRKRHPILSKIFKHPSYQLPIWLAFHWYNKDLIYKTKWSQNDFRFEYPPHITLVLFGYAISITAHSPIQELTSEDDYWEAMLLYANYTTDLKRINEMMGMWTYNKKRRWAFDINFLKNQEDRNLLAECQVKSLLK